MLRIFLHSYDICAVRAGKRDTAEVLDFLGESYTVGRENRRPPMPQERKEMLWDTWIKVWEDIGKQEFALAQEWLPCWFWLLDEQESPLNQRWSRCREINGHVGTRRLWVPAWELGVGRRALDLLLAGIQDGFWIEVVTLEHPTRTNQSVRRSQNIC